MSTMKSVGISGMLMGYKAGLLHGGCIKGEQGLKDLKEIMEYIEQLQAENKTLKQENKKLRRIEHRIKMETEFINPNWLEVVNDIRETLKGGEK